MNQLTPQSETMTSTQLASLLCKEKKHVHEAIKHMFGDNLEGRNIRPTFRANGQVDEYLLGELESKMFVAKHDMDYLEMITQYWIERSKPKAMTTMEMVAASANAMVILEQRQKEQEFALEANIQQVEAQGKQIASIEHKLTNRCNHVGYMFWTDAKRKHCPKLSDDFVKKMLTIEGVRTKMDTFLHNGFVTQVQSVLECDFLAALDEVMTHSIQVSPQFKEHPYLGRFKSK